MEEPTEAPEEVEYQGREALVAPDLSDLPDDIGDDFERAIEATVLEFKEGDIVEGTVVSVDGDGAMIDIGYKSEGLIPTVSSPSATTSTPTMRSRWGSGSKPSSSTRRTTRAV